MIYGMAAVRRWDTVPAQYRAAMIQGNLFAEEGWQSLKWKYQEGYSRKADGIKRGDADLIILPEAPSPVSYEQDAEYRSSMQRIASRFKLGLVFNNIAIEDSGNEHRYFNSAYFMYPDGKIGGRYDKIHLVPFGEYIPLKSLFAFTQTISKDVGDFSPGNESPLAIIGREPASAMICFEAVFPHIARRLVLAGSRLIINLTNDAWYGTSAAPYQHLMMTRWRALENRRFLLRATNSGISAVIDPVGRVQISTGILKEDICVGKFAFIGERSFYTRHGDWFPQLCAIVTIAMLLVALADQFRVLQSRNNNGAATAKER
jgi:apolipoprotein N-acyltransferase